MREEGFGGDISHPHPLVYSWRASKDCGERETVVKSHWRDKYGFSDLR